MSTSRPDLAPDRDARFDAVIVGAGFAGLYMLHRLRQAGLPLRFVTNVTRKPFHSILEDLHALGFELSADELITAPRAARRYLLAHGQQPGWKLLDAGLHAAPEQAARDLELNTGASVFRLHRLRLADDGDGGVNIVRQDTELADEFRRRVVEHPQVQACHMISGSIDFILEVVASDLDAFGQFIDGELLRMPAVKDASSSIVLKVVKAKQAMID